MSWVAYWSGWKISVSVLILCRLPTDTLVLKIFHILAICYCAFTFALNKATQPFKQGLVLSKESVFIHWIIQLIKQSFFSVQVISQLQELIFNQQRRMIFPIVNSLKVYWLKGLISFDFTCLSFPIYTLCMHSGIISGHTSLN